MIETRPIPLRLAALLLVLALPLACNKAREATDEGGSSIERDDPDEPRERPVLFNPDPSPPAPAQLVPPLIGPSVGMQPGYLDGAFMFASVRAGALQEFGQSVPLKASDARDLGEIGEILGADPRVDDILGHLGVDPQARASVSIRPIIDQASAVKQTLDDAGPILDELTRPPTVTPDQQPPSQTLSADAELFLDRVESLGLHVRGYVPLADPTRSKILLDTLKAIEPDEWAKTCAMLPPSLVCGGERDGMAVLRPVPGGLQFDAILFFKTAHDEADTELRRTLIQQAVALPAAQSIPGVGALRGDANLLIASAPTVNALRTAEMAQAIRELEWMGRDALTGYQNHDDALRAFHDVERVFDGIKIEARLDQRRIHASLVWLPTALGKQEFADMFELRQVDAEVPALAAMCEGSLLCARSRGVPSTARFESLATGPFASPEAFEAMWDRGDEQRMQLLLLLESWPNALGMLAKFPGQSLAPAEAVMAGNVKQAVDRMLAFGLVIRKFQVVSGTTNAEWAGFARMPEMDLATLRSLLGLGEFAFAPATLEGVPGTIESSALPSQNPPGRFYSIVDPPIATGSWGWAIVADGDERARWLLGQPRDDGAAPIAYLEVRDLWGLLGGVDEFANEFGHARAWLDGRSLRAQWDHTKDGPELRLLSEKAAEKPNQP